MPKVTDSIIPVELPAEQRRAYHIFAEEGLVVWKRHMIEAPIPLTKLLRLQQMTGGWVHDEAGESVAFQTAKMEAFTDLLADLAASSRSVVVFARFLAEMDAIYEAGVRYYKGHTHQIRGGVPASRRREIVRSFQEIGRGPNLLVVQVAAAEALDGIQRVCSEGIFYSSDYSLIHWAQARGRLDRVGQERPVTFYHLHAKGTVDSLVLEALRDKKNLERMVMDNPDILLTRS
jgi:SNF2 family DNA or RNA helicase